MTEPSAPTPEVPSAPQPTVGAGPHTPAPKGIWERLKHHKVAQWTLAYAAAAYTLLHSVEMISEAMDWPHLVARILTLLLGLGVPVVITLAWYHGAKGSKRISAPELLIVTLLLFLVGSVLWYQTRSGSSQTVSASSDASRAPTAPTAPRTSIAVMPFANLTGDPSKDYLGDGMAEEVIDTLTKVAGLKVPARTSSFAYKGRSTDIRQIARDLQVGTVLEGSVRSAGDRIRITAQLINGQDGLHLWSGTYDRKFTDLFQLQDDLATAIVQALQVNLNGASPAPVTAAPPTRDVEAYQLYLQGRSAEELASTEQGLRDAMGMFDRALARDPRFARAYVELAATRLIILGDGFPLKNALSDAERDARQGLTLDPSLASGYDVLGTISAYRGRWIEADASFQAALARDAGDSTIHDDYGVNVLTSVGYMRKALGYCREAYRLAPADPYATLALTVMHSLMGADNDALKFANLAILLGNSPDGAPLPQVFANAAMRAGRYREAADRSVVTLPTSMRAAGGDAVIKGAYAAIGDPAQKPAAAAALQSLLSRLKTDDLDANTRKVMILTLAQLNALDLAFQFANQSLDQFARGGTVGSAWGSLWMPEMRPFRRDPRFEGFVTRLGLMPYWTKFGAPDDCDLKDGKLTCH
jgi:TolB-like protein